MNEKETQTDETVSTPSLVIEDTTTEVVTTDADTKNPVTETSTEVNTDESVATEEDVASTDAAEDGEVMTEEAEAAPVAGFFTKAKRWVLARKYTIATVILVIVALLMFTYMLEKQGRIQTGIFEAPQKLFSSMSAVAKVNGERITKAALDTSMTQIAAGAAAQGMDVNNPELQGQIRTQALDMLINTELLIQKAEKDGISISDEDVQARLDQLITDIGGEEVLNERMTEFGIDAKTLRRDIKNELTIQKLLEGEFATRGITITDEEIAAFYASAGGEDAGLPALEEVSEQIRAQIETTKEQEIVTAVVE